jgi:uncharacterized membrane protein AbrB (regulator of aidB expression)
MIPKQFRMAVGRDFDKGLDILVVATGIAILVGAMSNTVRASAPWLLGTLVVATLVVGAIYQYFVN